MSPSLATKPRSLASLATFGLFFALSAPGAAALPAAGAAYLPGSSHATMAESSLGELEVQWKGKALSLEDLSSKLEAGQSAAILEKLKEYSSWIVENKYAVALSRDARVILVSQSRDSKRRMKLVEETLQAFDGLLAPPQRDSDFVGNVDASASTADEDDIFADAFGPISTGEEELHVPDSEPVVLFEIAKEKQYHDLLAGIGQDHPRMEAWANSVTSEPGFAEEQISTAAWQAAPDGYEVGDVWRSENELVNRLARLLMNRSFGVQPTWLRVAAAWRVEMEVQDDIYCFPYRQEFVGIGDHGGWAPALKTQFKKRKKKPLRMEEFATWRRNSWVEDQAHVSWGVVEYLANFQPGALPAIAEEFRVMFNEGFRTTDSDGTWTTNPRYEISIEDQAKVLAKYAGEEYLTDISEFFAKGRSYRPKKSK